MVGPMGRSRNRGALLLALAALLCLFLPAAASADRHPTPSERRGIEQAAHRGYGEPGAKVRVSGMRVSTTNRAWATADVAVDHGASTQEYSGEFHQHGNGLWTDEEVGKMPAAVEDDLGLSDSSGGLEKVVRIATFVVLGLLAFGVLAWLSKLAKGGAPDAGRGSAPDTDSRGPSPAQFSPASNQAKKRNCPVCNHGRITVPCRRCGGRKVKDNPHPPPPTIMCDGCFGRGTEEQNCGNCNGTGKVQAYV
jgi:hypothetical protein